MTITSFNPEVLPVIDNSQDFSIQLAVDNFPEASNWQFTQETHVPEGASLTSSGLLTYKKKESPNGNYGIGIQCTLPNGQVLIHQY